MVRYHLGQVARILGLKGFGARRLSGFRVDSRQVGKGDLFFALKGQKADGHAYLGDVAARGATAAVVGRDYVGPDHGLALLRVVDVLEALQALARYRMARHPAKVVAVTGSVGKTTTKEFLLTLLAQRYRVGGSKGNNNSQIGLPLTVLNDLADDEEVVVLEMGMTHPGNITQLLSIAPADIAVLTGVALAHAERYDSLEHIARTKAEIFTHPKTSVGIVSRDIPNFDEVCLIGNSRKVSCSADNLAADYRLEQVKDGLFIMAEGGYHPIGMFRAIGKHHRHNLVTAVATARALGVDWTQIAQAVPLLTLPERRMQVVEKGGVVFVNDSYNACEVSVKAALDALPTPTSGGRRVAVLGTMPELGKFSAACHRAVGDYALDKVDAMFCLGEECQPIMECWHQQGRKEAQLFNDRATLTRSLEQYLQPGDVALLKGANAKKMWEILDEIALPR